MADGGLGFKWLNLQALEYLYGTKPNIICHVRQTIVKTKDDNIHKKIYCARINIKVVTTFRLYITRKKTR